MIDPFAVLMHLFYHPPLSLFLYLAVSLIQGLQGVSVGRPRPLRPATDLHERIQSLAGFHAPGALPDEAGPRIVQGPGFNPEEEIQGH